MLTNTQNIRHRKHNSVGRYIILYM